MASKKYNNSKNSNRALTGYPPEVVNLIKNCIPLHKAVSYTMMKKKPKKQK